MCRPRNYLLGESGTFIADQNCRGAAQVMILESYCTVCRRHEGKRLPTERLHKRRHRCTFDDIELKVCSLRRPQNFWRPRKRGANAEQCMRDTKCRRAAQHGADVAGVLYVIEHENRIGINGYWL